MANTPFQYPMPHDLSPRQDDEHVDFGLNNPGYGSSDVRGAFARHNLPQGLGSNEYAPHVSGDWMMAPFHPRTTHSSSTMHARASSDVLQATNVPTYIDPHNRRSSVPFDAYTPQHALNYNPGSQTLQGHPLMTQSQYQPRIQPTMPGLVARPSMVTPQITGGPLSGLHSHSPPRIPQYTPGSSPHPHPRLDPNFTFGTPLLPHVGQDTLAVPSVGHNGGSRSRSQRSSPHNHPYRDTRRPSWTWDDIARMHAAGLPTNPSPSASSSQIGLDDSESATSPGADSDLYYSIPNTPADTTGSTSATHDDAALREQLRKDNQKVKKKSDRGREADQLLRVKTLLDLPTAKRVDVLKAVILLLGGTIPPQSAGVLPGGKRPRSEQVKAGRAVATQLFDVVGKCMGYTTKPPPKRELLLEEVADRIAIMLQHPGPQGGGGQGGNYTTQ